MARRIAACLLVVNVGLCSGRRMELSPEPLLPEPEAALETTSACPPSVILDSKDRGVCLDGASKTRVEPDCCKAISACHKQIGNVRSTYEDRLEVYMLDCELLPSDVAEVGGTITVADKTRLCAPGCIGHPAFGRPVATTDPSSLRRACPDSLSQEMVGHLTTRAAFTQALEAARIGCTQTTPAPATLAPTTAPTTTAAAGSTQPKCDRSMVGHDCGTAGTKQGDCEQKGCCWDPPARQRPGRPWCYKPTGSVQCERRCPHTEFPRALREDCAAFLSAPGSKSSDDTVRGSACQQAGCCWQPLNRNSKEPWCFHTPCL